MREVLLFDDTIEVLKKVWNGEYKIYSNFDNEIEDDEIVHQLLESLYKIATDEDYYAFYKQLNKEIMNEGS